MKQLAKIHDGLKVRKFLWIVAIVTILSLLAAALPATPALAAERLRATPSEGKIGDYIDVTGTSYKPDTSVYIYFSSQEAAVGSRIDREVTAYEKVKTAYAGPARDPEEGKIDTSFLVPEKLSEGATAEEVRDGEYHIYATYSGNKTIIALYPFTVIASQIAVYPNEGPVGIGVEVTGNRFADTAEITIYYDGKEVDIASGDEKTDKYGEFNCTILIPESAAGKHIITVTEESSPEALAEFIVEPEITLTPVTAAAGDIITVNGTGFGKKVDVSVTLDRTEAATGQTDESGSFEVTLTLPAKSPDIYYVEAKDEDNNKDGIRLTMVASIELSQTTGNVGSEVTVSGNGFIPEATVTITYDTEPSAVATATADADGRFSATFIVPKSEHGEHTITATDGTSTSTATFTMESMPPPTPTLLMPQIWTKAKSQAYFDWSEVTDPSGATYILQVATENNFTARSIVLEKEGLTRSEYTLTEEERLKSTRMETTYYWRVKAVDSADNKGDWTTPGAFYVGFTFELVGWFLFTVMGAACLLFFFIGFVLGRKTS